MGVTVIPGAAAGGTLTTFSGVWNGLQKQSPLDDDTDYFDDSSLDAAWSEVDHSGTIVSVTEGSDGLALEFTESPGEANVGVYRAAPTHSAYNVTVHLRADIISQTASKPAFGIALADGVASSSNLFTLMFYTGETSYVAVYSWPAYNTGFSLKDRRYDGHGLSAANVFFRFHVTATTVQVLFSTNGRNWVAMEDPYTIAATGLSSIAHVGIVGNMRDTSGDTNYVYSDMYRVDETSDPFEPVGSALQARV